MLRKMPPLMLPPLILRRHELRRRLMLFVFDADADVFFSRPCR